MSPELNLVRLEVQEDGEREGARAKTSAAELYGDLRKYLPAEALSLPESEGEKGDPATLMAVGIALLSSPVLTELVRCLRDWVRRRPSARSVVVRDGAGRALITVDAKNVEDATVVEALRAATAKPST